MAFLYDSIITTGDEIRCFWGHKVTGAAILFWLNKYASLLYFVWNLGAFMEIPEKVRIMLPVDCNVLLTYFRTRGERN